MSNPSRRDAPLFLDIQSLHAAIDPIDDYATKIYVAAMWYGSNGFKIVPFTPGGYPKGLSQHNASADLTKIEEWWNTETGKYPGCAIAMAHGGESGLCAIDLDVKPEHTKAGQKVPAVNGIETLSDLIMAYGDYQDGSSSALDTLMASTPSGGRHLIFKYHPEIISNSEISYRGIDTRGGLKRNPVRNGGITFVEPSRSIKGSVPIDHIYRWDKSGTTNIIDMPKWLVETLNGRPPQRGGLKLQDEYVQSSMGEHGEGRDRNIYMDLMRFVGIGYTEKQLWALEPEILARMDPPDPAMVKRKIESAIESEAFVRAQSDVDRKEKSDSLKLDKNDKGAVQRTAKNLKTVLTSAIFEHSYGLMEYDEFYHKLVKDKEKFSTISDYGMGISFWLSEELQMEYGSDLIRRAVESLAHERPFNNAARNYMLACPSSYEHYEDDFWGSGRKGPGPQFKRLCTEILDLSNPKLHEDYTKYLRSIYEAQLWFWMQGVAARACVPGCKMEMVINIFGDQGIGKSTFFKELCPDPEWFTDSIKDAVVDSSDNKDELEKLHGCLIAEMPELSPIKKAGKSSDDRFKQFISTQVDRFRASYKPDTADYKRTCALAGTSNNRDVYRDMTGDRRFLSIDHGGTPIRLGDLSTGVMDEIRDLVWGEIIASFLPGELDQDRNHLLICIPGDLRKHQSIINNKHRYEEIGAAEVLDWARERTRFTHEEIISYARSIPGLRDDKESVLLRMIKNALVADKDFTFGRRISRQKEDGSGVEKRNMWVNHKHLGEADLKPGQPALPHWKNTEVPDEDAKPEEY